MMTIGRRELVAGVAAFGASLMLGPDLKLRRAQAQSASFNYGVYPDVSPFVWTARDWTSKYGVKTNFTWYAGVIDGAVIWEPFPALMEFQKSGRIIQQFAKWVSDLAMLQTLNTTLEKNRDSVVKLVAGALDCQDFIRSNPKEAARIVSEGMATRGLTVPPEAFEVVIKDRLKWDPDITNVEASLTKVGEIALKLGRIPRAPQFNFRPDILNAARALRKA